MTVSTIYIILIIFLIGEFTLTQFLAYLNARAFSEKLPDEVKEIYDAEKYKTSMQYEKAKRTFSLVTSSFTFILVFLMVLFGGFGAIYTMVSQITNSELLRTLLFFGILGGAQVIIFLPFSFYSTFILEQKFGFNKTDKKTFFSDKIKGVLLGGIIGGILISIFALIYQYTQGYFWILAWGVMSVFSLVMMMFFSSIIVPLFNKQTPLEQGDLRDEIENFAKKMGFQLDNIYVIDGSKRSSKSNAYFSGLGPKKRIVLYDTLIEQLSNEELVAVLAHEIGHYKLKHIPLMFIFSVMQSGIILYLLGLMLGNSVFAEALGGHGTSFALSIVAFGILFTPISIIFGVFGNILSRKHEFEADAYSAKNYDVEKMKHALRKLSLNNLSNLTPHPMYEFFYYSHPRVLRRIQALEKHKA